MSTPQRMFPPENHIGARAIISRLVYQSISSDQAIAMAFEDTALMASRALFKKYVTTQISSHPETDIVAKIDCYVFSASELGDLLLEARRLGERDAMRWLRQKP